MGSDKRGAGCEGLAWLATGCLLRCLTDAFFQVADGKLFLICEGEIVSIQRVFRSGPKLTLISGGAMRQVRPKDIEIVGRVVWVERGWAP